MFAIAGKLLHQIFLPKSEASCLADEILNRPVYAPLRIAGVIPSREMLCMCFRLGAFSFTGYANFGKNNVPRFSDCDFQQWCREVALRIALTFKVKVDVDVSYLAQFPKKHIDFVLSRVVDRQDDERAVELYVPLDFFSRLVGISLEADADAVEQRLAVFLRDGLALFPDISLLLELLSEVQLQRLISQLRINKMLTVYQLSLLCLAFPQYAIKIKHALSKNTIKEVSDMMRRIRSDPTFGERDLAIGVYSVEDAIYRLISAGGEVKYSWYLRELQKFVSEIQMREIFLAKSFPEWIEVIERDGLLYQVLIQIQDAMIARAFHNERELFERTCEKIFTQRKLEDIQCLRVNDIALNDVVQARSKIVSAYRSMCVKRRNWGAESFEYVIRGMNDAVSFRRLLLETGWFTLSTALKNMRSEIIAPVLAELPKPARYLIEDVLCGVLNPNILHDELQIQEARAKCVRKALDLYEKGLIRLVV